MNNDYLLTIHPTTEANWPNENVRTEGMVLRDYFAAKAMAAIISNSAICDSILPKINQEKVTIASYEVADAMLEARNK